MSEQTDLLCRMKRCHDCHDWKPRDEFPARSYGTGIGRSPFCKPCLEIRRMAVAARKREWMAKKRREMGCAERPNRSNQNRLPPETVIDFAMHAFPYWQQRKFHLADLAIAQAPRSIRPAVKNKLLELAKIAA